MTWTAIFLSFVHTEIDACAFWCYRPAAVLWVCACSSNWNCLLRPGRGLLSTPVCVSRLNKAVRMAVSRQEKEKTCTSKSSDE